MSGQQVSLLLQECLRRAVSGPTGTAEALPPLSDELSSLLQEAADMKWPFVEEKWQYKQSVTSEDKINSSDLIKKHLPQLLIFLRESITADEPKWAVAVVFLLDRLLYWMDSSHVLLKIAKTLHKRYPEIPIAPQVIIRQARVYLNSGKLQKAEYILSSLINNNGSTGAWTYQKASDQTLVQAVSLQVRGQVLQKLGLWLEAAELMWASLIGFYALPQPDKKGIGTSLGLLANILISMNDSDFAALQKKPHIDFSLLGERRHRLLSAARAAKMAVVYSQYGSLYVLTNVVAQGTCLLSYSFSKKCPVDDQQTYLALAKEAFEIGLLTKTTGDVVTSKLELHTFLKAAYCLATTHRWMAGLSQKINMAMQTCREAMTIFLDYCTGEHSTLCTEIMAKIQKIKLLLNVQSFRNSDPCSFIPDSFRSVELVPILFTPSDFAKVLDGFRIHHTSVCEALENDDLSDPKGASSSTHVHCITAFQTNTEVLTTECDTENLAHPGHVQKALGGRVDPSRPAQEDSDGCSEGGWKRESSGSFSSRLNPSSSGCFFLVDPNGCTETQSSVDEQSSLGSFEAVPNYSNGSHGSNQSSNGSSKPNTSTHNKTVFQELCTTEDSEDISPVSNIPDASGTSTQQRDKKNLDARTSSSSLDSSWEKIAVQTQSAIETMEDILDSSYFTNQTTSNSVTNPDAKVKSTKDGSTSSYSLIDSFGSHSSWQKLSMSPVTNQPANEFPLHASGSMFSSNKLLKSQGNLKPAIQTMGSTLSSTESDAFEELGFEHLSVQQSSGVLSSTKDNAESCNECFKNCISGSDVLTEHDYKSLFAGVCHSCLVKRLPNKSVKPLEPQELSKAYNGIVLKFSKATDVWMGYETSVYIGKCTGDKGKQRQAMEVQHLHQEQLLSSYVGKEYLNEKGLHAHLNDVERQMTAQYYVTEFNKRLYDNNVTTQIFFIPSEVMLVLEKDRIVTCLSAEPYMSGEFLKITNNTKETYVKHQATKYGIAFGHFTYEFSNHEEVVVDLQGWVTANGKGLTYLTDPQIHSLRKPRSSNFQQMGINYFLKYQHGDECNEICRAAGLKRITTER
ncbi:alpha-protein kinase 1 [Xyrauchen texanus]|uniref:alpha-protein kinase 1 n=1 Tax=Xyrauchen texanus TaxID=154827 RepID=UPI002241D53F|nr:alpha-protein kinase 1 [Xyrauchen texanus]